MLTLFETYKLILESKKTEEQSLNILSKANISDSNQILEDLKSIDKSDNQKNLPFMATIVTWNPNDSNIINNMDSIFQKYEELLKNNNIKPMQLIQNIITIGDNKFNDFLKLAEYIDATHTDYSYVQKRKNEIYQVYENEDVPLLSSNGIDVYDGNEVGKCIKYTQGLLTGRKYTFCIGQPSNTMYQSYRDSKDSTFYFVVDRNKFKTNSDGSVNLDDPLHIVVYDVTRNGVELTDADNRTGNISEYGKDVQGYISYLKSNGIDVDTLTNKPKTPEEEAEQRLLGIQKDSLEWFMELSYEMKSKYIGRGHKLTDEQFDVIFPIRELVNQYVNIGIAIPYNQYKKVAQAPSLLKSYLRARNTATQNGDKLEYYEMNDEQLEELKAIRFESKNLTEFPNFILKANNITELNLIYNKITEIPESIENLQNLTHLYLTENKLETLSESFGNLQNLKYLYLSLNPFKSLPESFGNLQNLIHLSLRDCGLTSLPESLGNLQNLKRLELNDNQLKTLPNSIRYLENLQMLYLKNNQLTTLPNRIGDLDNLEWIDLSGNYLTSLPESIKYLQRLKSLDLRGNSLSPEYLSKLQNEILPNCRIIY
jgi:Leucine-rich repeat (LRR) protein